MARRIRIWYSRHVLHKRIICNLQTSLAFTQTHYLQFTNLTGLYVHLLQMEILQRGNYTLCLRFA
jgi:hypothetical protein